jgi:hypothetical protein
MRGRFVSYAKKFARLGAYLAFVQAVLLGVAVRSVRGDAKKGALQLGSELATFGDVAGGPDYRVLLNGESLHFASATTDKSVDEVLDRFEGECREHSGGLEGDFARLASTLSSKLPPTFPADVLHRTAIGILRDGTPEKGFVSCFAHDGDGGYGALLAALRELSRTGDLASLGALRYVLAERRPDGSTHVISAWTDGSFRLDAMFPATGDAPGNDPGEPVRPPQSRRLLSASVAGSPFGVLLYESTASQQAILAHYDTAMTAEGWKAIALGDDTALGAGRAFTRQGVDLMIHTSQGEHGRMAVAIASMPPR